MMMIHPLLVAIVQGLTEAFPVSSSAHIAWLCIDNLNSAPIHRMLVLDNVTCTQPLPSYITVVPCAELLANTLNTMNIQSSMAS